MYRVTDRINNESRPKLVFYYRIYMDRISIIGSALAGSCCRPS